MNEEQKRVRQILEAYHAPLILNPGGWGDSLPDYIRGRVIAERMAALDNGGWNEATDAEIAAHCFTASLCFPFNGDWTQIYMYEVSKVMPQIVDVMPEAGRPLTDSQERELKELKYKIRQKQIKEWKRIEKEESILKRKLVMEEMESTGKVLIGVMRGDYDPITISVEGTIESVLPQIPGFIIGAEEKWKTDPKFPKYVAPAVPPKPAKVVGAGGKKPTEDLPLLAGKSPAAPAKPEKTTEEELPLMPNAKPPATPEEAPSAVTATLQQAAGAPEEKPAGQNSTIPALNEANAAHDAAVARRTVSQQPEVKAETPAVTVTMTPGSITINNPTNKDVVVTVPVSPEPGAKVEFEFYLQDGRGPFENVQAAMDAMGVDKATRPAHNRWDRLSTDYKTRIPRRIKGQGFAVTNSAKP